MTYDAADHTVLLSNDDVCFGCTDYVLAYNDSSGNVVWSYVTGSDLAGQEPAEMTYVSDVRAVYVSNTESNSVSVVNASTGIGVGTISVGSPGAQVYDPENRNLYVADGSNQSLAAIDTVTNSVVGYWSYGNWLNGLAFDSATNDLFASSFNGGVVFAIDPATGSALATIPTPAGPVGLYYYAAMGKVFVADQTANNISVINDTQLNVVANIPGADAPEMFTYDSGNGSLYVGSNWGTVLQQVNPVSNTLTRGLGLAILGEAYRLAPQPLVYDPHSGDLYFASQSSNLLVVDPSSGYTTQELTGKSPSSAFYVPSLHELFVTDGSSCNLIPVNVSPLEVGVPFFAGCNQMGVTYDPSDGDLYVSDFGPYAAYGRLTAVNLTTRAVVGSWSVGYDVSGVAYDSTDQTIFVGSYYNISVFHPGTNTWNWSVYNFTGGLNPDNPTVALTWDSSGDSLYATPGNHIILLDAATYGVEENYSLRGLLYGATVDPRNNELFVAQYADQSSTTDNVSILNATTLAPIAILTPCGGPTGVVYDPVVDRVYVSCTSDQDIGIINPDTNLVSGTLGLGNDGWLGGVLLLQGGILCTFGSVGVLVIISPGTGWYDLQFLESGLPYGTDWGVAWNGTAARGNQSNFIFPTDNASASFSILSVTGYRASPPSGIATVNGDNETITVSFSPVKFPVTFRESGLTRGIDWFVNVTGQAPLSNTTSVSGGTSITTALPNGTYTFTAASSDKRWAPEYTPNFTVSAAPESVSIVFSFVTFAVVFQESGLPSDLAWSVRLNGTLESLTTDGGTDNLLFPAEPNGTYPYVVSGVAGWHQSTLAYGGSVLVNGAMVVEPTLLFTEVDYPATVTETGLPAGTQWFVNLTQGPSFHSTSSTLMIPLPNGTYDYRATTEDNTYVASYAPSFEVNGAPITIHLTFSLVTYTVTFAESGLPSATNWSVTCGVVTRWSTTATVTFAVRNGSYAFTVSEVSGYTATPAIGSVKVSGGNATQVVMFSSTTGGPTFLGLPGAEGYGLVVGMVVAAMVAGVAIGLLRRRRGITAPLSPAGVSHEPTLFGRRGRGKLPDSSASISVPVPPPNMLSNAVDR